MYAINPLAFIMKVELMIKAKSMMKRFISIQNILTKVDKSSMQSQEAGIGL